MLNKHNTTMETTVIMTNCSSPYGKYIMFETKGGRKHIGEVDCRDGKYVIYYNGNGHPLSIIGTRSKKDSAIRLLQESIRAGIKGSVKFRWNVVRERYRYA